MKKASISIALLTLLLISCGGGNVRNNRAKEFKNQCTLERTGEKVYPLDKNTSGNIEYLQYIANDSLLRFSFLNSHTNSIYLHDAESGKLLNIVEFDKEGANGVGSIQGYCYHNDDSIFVYAYGSGMVHLANNQGEVITTYPMFDAEAILNDTTKFLTSPYVESRLPMLYREDKLIMGGGFLAETTLEKADNTFVTLMYDVVNRTAAYANSYPEQYRKYDWGGGFFYRQPSMAMTPEGRLLISFPADHNLWNYDPVTQKRDSLYAGSRLIEKIVPFGTEKKKFPDEVPEQRLSDWYYSQPSYESIFADPYKHLYYRIARLPNAEHRPATLNDKPVVVIVLDKDLNYLGEDLLPEGVPYDTFNAYVSPEGLNIRIWNNDEDHLTFYTYNAKL